MASTVTLRSESDGADSRHLSALLDEEGDLVIHGHDLGPGTALIEPGGEHEWVHAVASEDLPALIRALGGTGDEQVLQFLEAQEAEGFSYDLETALRSGVVPVVTHVR